MISDAAQLRIDVISDRVKEAEGRLAALQGRAGGAERATGRLSGGFVKLGAAIGGAAVAMRLAQSAFGNVRSFERLNAQLITVTGSAARAKGEFDNLSRLSYSMPFSLEELTESFIQMKNRGLDPTNEALIAFGELAASKSLAIDDLVNSISNAATGEFQSLKRLGIMASNEGDVIRFAFRGITSEVANNAGAIQDYLVNLGNTNFAGSMARQMDTIDGKLSQIRDAWARFTSEIGDTTGATTGLAWALGKVAEAFGKSATALQAINAPSLQDTGVEHLGLLKKLLEDSESRGLMMGEDPAALRQRIKQLEAIKAIRDDEERQQKEMERASRAMHGIEEMRRRRITESHESTPTYSNLGRLDDRIRESENRILSGTVEAIDQEIDAIGRLMDAREKMEAQLREEEMQQATRLQGVRDSMRTETEIIREEYRERQQIAYEARQRGLIEEEEYIALRRQLRMAEYGDHIGHAKDFFASLQSLSGGNSKKLFRIQKGLALAQATVDGIQAVQKALANPPGWPYNAGAVIAAGATSAANIAAISSTEYSGKYQGGGVLRGSSTSGDRTLFHGNAGEILLNRAQQGNLLSIANSGGGGSGMSVVINNHSSARVEARETRGTGGAMQLEVTVTEIDRALAGRIRTGGSPTRDAIQSTFGLAIGGGR